MGSTWQSTPAQQDYEAAESMLQHSRAGRNVPYPPLTSYQPSDPSNYVQQPPHTLKSAAGGSIPHNPPSPGFLPGPIASQSNPTFSVVGHSNFLPPPDLRRAGAGLSLPKLYGRGHSQRQPSPPNTQPSANIERSISDRQTRVYQVDHAPTSALLDSRGLEDNREEYWRGHADGDDDETGSVKEEQDESEDKPSWAFEKTKAGKERKRLPLACIACRRKKIRCSGEKPACRHCIRAKMPCVYKVTTRKAAPRTDYMAMLDRRLKRMEERIIRTVPKSGNQERKVPRAMIRPPLAKDAPGIRKRDADEAFDTQVEDWVKSNPHPHSFKSQKLEEDGIYKDGADQLPSKEIQRHLAEVFFEYVYGQSYHIMHQPSYMRKLQYVAPFNEKYTR